MSGEGEDAAPVDQAELLQRIDGFWAAFRAGEAGLIELPAREQVEKVNEILETHVEGLALEMMAEDGDRQIEMIATAHGSSDRFPLLLDFVKRAPPLAHYTVTAFRARTTEPDFPMRMDDFELATHDVSIGHYADEGRVGMEVMFSRELPSDMQDHAKNMAFIMLDHVLGEYDFAVKVGCVDFVDGFSDAVLQTTPLHQFGAVFDGFWAGTLGHTGLFPAGEHRWGMLELMFGGDEDDVGIVAVNESANAVAARPDLGYAIQLRLAAGDSAALHAVREVQDQIASRLEQQQAGILSYTLLRQGQRQATYYVGDLPAALQVIETSVHAASVAGIHIDSDFDPSWLRYFEFAGNLEPSS